MLAVLVGAKYDEETWLWPCLVVVGVVAGPQHVVTVPLRVRVRWGVELLH